MDTDSVIFVTRPGEENPPLGDYLGEFKSELDGDDFIKEFVSAGPKNYGYCTKKGKTECKVRGFSLNTKGLEQLNYNVVRQNVLDEILEPLEDGKSRVTDVVKPHHIVRNAKQYALETIKQRKKYQLVCNKRVVEANTFRAYPYGYTRDSPIDWNDRDLVREQYPRRAVGEVAQTQDLDAENVQNLMELCDPEARMEAMLEEFI